MNLEGIGSLDWLLHFTSTHINLMAHQTFGFWIGLDLAFTLLPYGWNEMQGVNLANLLWSEYWEFELHSFCRAQFSSLTVPH